MQADQEIFAIMASAFSTRPVAWQQPFEVVFMPVIAFVVAASVHHIHYYSILVRCSWVALSMLFVGQ
jgi:hypothetical protein